MEKSLIEKYEGRYKLRALISLIPHIGGALDFLLSEKGSKWREQRIEIFLKELDTRLGNLETKEIKNEIINSEEFYDLMIQTLNAVIRTRHLEKIKCFSNLLKNHILSEKKSSVVSNELMVSILDSLTIDEMKYFSILKKNDFEITLHKILQTKVIWENYRSAIEKSGNTASNQQQLPNESVFEYSIDIVWKMLSDKNLIFIENKKELGKLNYTWKTQWQSGAGQIDYNEVILYKITDFGKEFSYWIENKTL